MDYANGLVRASAEHPPRWDFSNWTFLAVLESPPEETSAVHEYGFEPQRRAWAIVTTAVQHQHNTADVNVTQVEARADRRRASAKESGALPSSQASLCELTPSEKSAVLSKQTPSQMQATSEREKREDLALVLLMEVGRRAEEQDELVVYEQQAQALPPPPPPPPSCNASLIRIARKPYGCIIYVRTNAPTNSSGRGKRYTDFLCNRKMLSQQTTVRANHII